MRWIFTLVCALVFSGAGTWTAPPAHADDADPGRERDEDFVGRLTQDEVALLKKKIPTWDQLDDRKKNRIARHVLRLREMDPEEQARFHKRIARLRDMRKDQSPDVRRRGHASSMAVVGQAMEAMLAADWPEGVRLAEDRQWSKGRLVGSFLRHVLMPRAAAYELERVEAEGVDLKSYFDDMPEGARKQKILSALERARNGDKGARRMVGGMLAHRRMRTWSKAWRSAPETTDSAAAQVTAQLRAAWAQPYQQALEDVRANVDRFVVQVETPRGRRGPVRTREWVNLVRTLEDVAGRAAKDDPALAKDADALMTRVLRDHLKIPPAQIDSLPARSQPHQRKRAFYRMLMQHVRNGNAQGADRAFPGRGKRLRPGMREEWQKKRRERAEKKDGDG